MSYDEGDPCAPETLGEPEAIGIAIDTYAAHGWRWLVGEWRQLCTKSHQPERVKRYRAVVAALRAKGWSTVAIGRVLGRDHSTVVQLLRAMRAA